MFLGKSLLPLTIAGSRTLEEITGKPADYCGRSAIFAEYFNVNSLSTKSKPLLNFLKKKFSLRMINGRNYPVTKEIIQSTLCSPKILKI